MSSKDGTAEVEVIFQVDCSAGAGVVASELRLSEAEDVAAAVEEVLELVRVMFPVTGLRAHTREKRARELISRALLTLENVFTERAAIDSVGEFRLPGAIMEADLALFQACGRSITEVAKIRQGSLREGRLSVDKVRRCLNPTNPEFVRMLELAEFGMRNEVDPEFVSNFSRELRPPLRRKAVRMASVIESLVYESFIKLGLGIVLPLEESLLMREKGGCFNCHDWTPKQGAVKGRPIGDCKGIGVYSLNSQHTKKFCDERCGVIEHPTLRDLVVTILDFYDEARAADPSVCWQDIVLFKKDMKGAYTLLDLDPGVVNQFAFELTDERVVFFLCGIFGWTGTPAHFQIVTRALLWELRPRVSGRLNMFVDDFMGVCLRWNVTRNMEVIDVFCERLFGAGCIAPNKDEVGRRLPHIGFEIDLDSGLVELTERNMSKALVGFFSYGKNGEATVVQMQRLASWGSRYSDICVFMRPFVAALYRSYVGKRTSGLFRLSCEAMRAVRVFRMFLVLTAIEPQEFARPLSSFRPGSATHVLEYDASLSGIGVVWYAYAHGREIPIGFLSVDITALGFGVNAAFQNSAEFIALVIAVFGLRWFNLKSLDVTVRGDSKTALKWSEKGRCKGTTANNASVVFSLVVAQAGVTVVDRVFLDSKENWRADLLSRGGSKDELIRRDGRFVDIPFMREDVSPIVQLCDPSRVWNDEKEFVLFWDAIKAGLGIAV